LTGLSHRRASALGFRHAQLALQIIRRRRAGPSGRWHTETVYAVTDLGWRDIRADQLADIVRDHWRIEVRGEVALVE